MPIKPPPGYTLNQQPIAPPPGYTIDSGEPSQPLLPGVTRDEEGRYGSEAPPSNLELYKQALFNPIGSGARPQGVLGGIEQIGGRAMQGLLSPLSSPLEAAKGVWQSVRHPEDTVNGRIGEFKDEWNKSPALALENAAGDALALGEGGRVLSEVPEGAGKVFSAIPTRARAGALFEDVMKAAKDQPITISPETMDPLERTQRLAMAGGKPFGTADKLYQRLNQTQPLTYGEARDFAQNMSLSPEEKMSLKRSMKYEVPRLSRAFNEDVGRAAEQAGKGPEYQKAMRTYRRAMTARRLAGNAGRVGAKVGIPAALGYAGYKTLKDLHGLTQ